MTPVRRLGIGLVAWCAFAGACSGGSSQSKRTQLLPLVIPVTSTDFTDGGTIPARFTCDGANTPPALMWSAPPPSGTHEQELVMDDPDAPGGGFVHWVVVGMDAAATTVPPGAHQGRNGRGASGYTGPCPPRGSSPHHYRFHVYAVSVPLGLGDGTTAADVQAAVAGHIVAEGVLTGTYARP